VARFHKGQKIPLFAKKPRPVTAIFVPGQSGPERELTTHPYPVQRLEVNGAIPPLPYIPSWHALGQFGTLTHNPCLVTAVVSTLKSSGWRHVESEGRKWSVGGGGGVLRTHFSVIYMELQGRIKGIFVNTSKQNLPFQNNYVVTLQCLSQGQAGCHQLRIAYGTLRRSCLL